MAQWIGAARSNYVRIADLEGLKKALENFDITIAPNDTDPTLFCLLSEGEYGGWPSAYDEETDEQIDFNPVEHVCPFMAPGEILVLMEAGAEKLRYITGFAQAYHQDGRSVTISLAQIYAKAAVEFGVPEDKITAAEY